MSCLQNNVITLSARTPAGSNIGRKRSAGEKDRAVRYGIFAMVGMNVASYIAYLTARYFSFFDFLPTFCT